MIKGAPHQYLFPRCCGAVFHGKLYLFIFIKLIIIKGGVGTTGKN